MSSKGTETQTQPRRQLDLAVTGSPAPGLGWIEWILGSHVSKGTPCHPDAAVLPTDPVVVLAGCRRLGKALQQVPETAFGQSVRASIH
ncbi:hypothetical protein Y1Q_0014078 [Alligator mississippiensis]|uniref:Uncharacterized protein n=1 Tax=Alligator mississippiensis TaxID=8496 RepID=A0A151MJR4_ALLMI|nr:hypothetical protein Y1Q_0014078 [Alligator mississippiensis]